MALALAMGTDIPLEVEPGPGAIWAQGPRHDNDKEHFREIQILPTDEEMRCAIPPYLPVNSVNRADFARADRQRFLEEQLTVRQVVSSNTE